MNEWIIGWMKIYCLQIMWMIKWLKNEDTLYIVKINCILSRERMNVWMNEDEFCLENAQRPSRHGNTRGNSLLEYHLSNGKILNYPIRNSECPPRRSVCPSAFHPSVQCPSILTSELNSGSSVSVWSVLCSFVWKVLLTRRCAHPVIWGEIKPRRSLGVARGD